MGLEYDQNAFIFFSIAIMIIILVPLSFYYLSNIYYTIYEPESDQSKLTSYEKESLKKVKKSFIPRLLTKQFIILTIIIGLLSFCLMSQLNNLGEGVSLYQYDPFEILGLQPGASDHEIKSAYRKLSLIYHPDKNNGDDEKFILISKAYQALTNEVAKENFEKYGNPDGPQEFKVSIGLPVWLTDQFRGNIVLLVYCVIFFVLAPAFVCYYYNRSRKYDISYISFETSRTFITNLNPNLSIHHISEILARADEFRDDIKIRDPDNLRKIYNIVTARDYLKKPKVLTQKMADNSGNPDGFRCYKTNLLIAMHLNRDLLEDVIPKEYYEEIDAILPRCLHLLDRLLYLASSQLLIRNQGLKLFTSSNIIYFQQLLIQGLWSSNNDPLYQIPYMNEDIFKKVKKNNKMNLKSFILSKNKRGLEDYYPFELEDVNVVCKRMPLIQLEIKAYTDGYDEGYILPGDIITLDIKLTRTNLEDGEEATTIHSRKFPVPVKEIWYIIVSDPKTSEIYSPELHIIKDQGKYVDSKVKIMLSNQQPGPVKLDVHAYCNGYIGLDVTETITITLADPKSVIDSNDTKLHPEDEKVLHDKNRFFQNPFDNDSGSESSGED